MKLFVFFFLAYTISWLTWLPLYGTSLGIGKMNTLPYEHAIGALGPIAAALITTFIFDRENIGDFFKRFISINSIGLLMISIFSPFVIAIVSIWICSIYNGSKFDLTGLGYSSEFPGWTIAGYFVYNLVFFGFGEEAGWRGYALEQLQYKFKPLTASIVLTAGWALWHLPLFFYRPGYIEMDIYEIAGWVFSLLAGSILLTWFYNIGMKSILICAVFHTTVDIAFTSKFQDPLMPGIMGILITIWGLSVAIMLYIKGKQLGTRPA